MTARAGTKAKLLLAAVSMALNSSPALTQVAATHEVRKGETLFGITSKVKPSGITHKQMMMAIQAANPAAFKDGDINRLQAGAVLAIPAADDVARILAGGVATKVREEAREVVAAIAPAPAFVKTPERPSSLLTPKEAAARYKDGLERERKGDLQGALSAFLQAGESGNGLAQRRLGQIYDSGNAVVPRDYQTSLKWYQKAREQGVSIDKPLSRAPLQ
jgi:FimV-like protein